MMRGKRPPSETEVKHMKTKSIEADANYRDHEEDEELAGVLMAISIVSKRLAKKLSRLSKQGEPTEEGGKPDEQDE
jgi:hypothetical protein